MNEAGMTASCFIHGDFDATLERCPECHKDACAHGCGFEGTVRHGDGRLLCRSCYASETGGEGDSQCPTCGPVTVQDDPPTTGHAERRGEPGESEDGLVKAGEYGNGTAFYFGEFVELPDDAEQEAER